MSKQAQYVTVFRRKRKLEGIYLLGGKCVQCGSTENLQFDHIDPKTKIFGLDKCQIKKELWLEELRKCQLLCQECHSKKSAREFSEVRTKDIKHGTLWAYQGRKCRCIICRKYYAEHRKRWNDGRN